MPKSYVVALVTCVCAVVTHADTVYDLNSAPAQTESQVVAALQSEVVSPQSIVLVTNGPMPGDATLDDVVNFADLIVLAQNYGCQSASWQMGDFTGDHKVGFADLIVLAQNYGDVGVAITAVPSPSAAWGGLALIGLLAGGSRLRNRLAFC